MRRAWIAHGAAMGCAMSGHEACALSGNGPCHERPCIVLERPGSGHGTCHERPCIVHGSPVVRALGGHVACLELPWAMA